LKNESILKLAKEKAELAARLIEIEKEEVEEKRKELIKIVNAFKSELTVYGLTIDEAAALLGFPAFSKPVGSASTASSKKEAAKITHVQRDGSGTWRGKGRKPKWLVEAIGNGAKLSDFAVSP